MIHWFNNNVHFNTTETAPTCPPDKLWLYVSSSLVRGEGCYIIQLIFPNPWDWKVFGDTEVCVAKPVKPVIKQAYSHLQNVGFRTSCYSTLLCEANSVVFTYLVSQLIGSNSSKSVDKLEKNAITWVDSEPREFTSTRMVTGGYSNPNHLRGALSQGR